MRGIMGLQDGGQAHPDQSDRARAEFWGRHEDAGREIPDDPWLKNMIWLDSLGVQRGERPMLEDKPWWVDLARKLRDLTRRHVPSLEDLDSLPFIAEHPNPDLNKTRNLLQHLDSIPFIAEHPNPDLNKTRNFLEHLRSIPFIAEHGKSGLKQDSKFSTEAWNNVGKRFGTG